MTTQGAQATQAATEAGVFAILYTTEKACHAVDFAALVKAGKYLLQAAEAIEKHRLTGIPELAEAAGCARGWGEAIAKEAEKRRLQGEAPEIADELFQIVGQLVSDQPADSELLLRLEALREGRLEDARATQNVRARLRLV